MVLDHLREVYNKPDCHPDEQSIDCGSGCCTDQKSRGAGTTEGYKIRTSRDFELPR